MAGETAPKAVPPTVAAKELRILARNAIDLNDGIGGKNPYSKHIKYLAEYVRGGLSYVEAVSSDTQSWAARKAITDARMKELRASIQTRRVGEAKESLDRALECLRNERSPVVRAEVHAGNASRHLSEAIAILPGGDKHQDYFPSSSGESATGMSPLGEMLQKMSDLIQSLPTTESLPKTKQETIIRGIVAILRTHDVPGIQGVTHEGVKTGNGTYSPEAASPEAPAVTITV